jgi:aryl-alcohol dehydrogenase-like predicted oxidoreductase
MDYIRLGSSGLKVSRICLGTLTFGDPGWRKYVLNLDESRPIVHRALELGINFFDTADMYSSGESEKILGRLLRESVRREEVVVATKVYFPMSDDPNDRGLSRKHIIASVEASLQRLETDYIDLYQIHRWDYETPIEETLAALHDLVRSGKVRYVGASSMHAWQFAKALYLADLKGWTRFVSMQNHYNLIYREEEREMLPLCLDEGIATLPWSPLARGFLAGNRSREGERPTKRAQNDSLADEMYFRESDFDVVDQVVKVAEEKGVSAAQVALAWLLHQPAVTSPIVGVRKVNHLEEAVEALEVSLSDDECALLEEKYQPHPILGHE